nr:TIGR02679 family protein [Thermosediminibacter litoriperuensis]
MEYFKSHSGYKRLFTAFRERYRSLGRVGGSVRLVNLTPEEKEVLSAHFRRDYSRAYEATVGLLAFEESLKGTRFEEYSLLQLLEAYFGSPLTCKREEEDAFLKAKEHFFGELLTACGSDRSRIWLEKVAKMQAAGWKMVHRRFVSESDRSGLFEDIKLVCEALDNLPAGKNERERLPVFSSRITKDPHWFDPDTFCGALFLNALFTLFFDEELKGGEARAEAYYRAGLIIDEISNFTTLCGLTAYKGDAGDPVWQAAFQNSQVLQVPLLNLSRVERVVSPLKIVFALENPGVFTALVDLFHGRSPLPPMVCTFGQPRLATLVLLDMLAKSGTQIFYSGDFDPEGLMIADKLEKRYKENFKFWRFSVEDYEKSLSESALNKKRLSILNNITSPELAAVKERIMETKKAGYQELLLEELCTDIIDVIS